MCEIRRSLIGRISFYVLIRFYIHLRQSIIFPSTLSSKIHLVLTKQITKETQGFESSKTSLTPPHVLCACPKSRVEVISYSCSFFMFCSYCCNIQEGLNLFYVYPFCLPVVSRACQKEQDSTLVEVLVKTCSLLIEFCMVDVVWSPLLHLYLSFPFYKNIKDDWFAITSVVLEYQYSLCERTNIHYSNKT